MTDFLSHWAVGMAWIAGSCVVAGIVILADRMLSKINPVLPVVVFCCLLLIVIPALFGYMVTL